MKAAEPSVEKVRTGNAPGFRKPVEKALDHLMNFIETAGAVLLALMTLIILWQIIARFRIIHIISPWTEEVAMILLKKMSDPRLTGVTVTRAVPPPAMY